MSLVFYYLFIAYFFFPLSSQLLDMLQENKFAHELKLQQIYFLITEALPIYVFWMKIIHVKDIKKIHFKNYLNIHTTNSLDQLD